MPLGLGDQSGILRRELSSDTEVFHTKYVTVLFTSSVMCFDMFNMKAFRDTQLFPSSQNKVKRGLTT